MDNIKEVIYEGYCRICKHFPLRDQDDPCNSCLTQSWNINSHKPVNFEKKDEKMD